MRDNMNAQTGSEMRGAFKMREGSTKDCSSHVFGTTAADAVGVLSYLVFIMLGMGADYVLHGRQAKW